VVGAEAVSLVITGCSAPIGSVVGIGVDQDGSPVAYVAVCEAHVDTAVIGDDRTEKDTGAWVTPPLPAGSFSILNLAKPTDGWTADTPAFSTLDPKRTYRFSSYGGDTAKDTLFASDFHSSISIPFTTSDLAKLAPGQVRYYAGTDKSGDRYGVVTEEAFRAQACR
jgi:hypothetical protein